MIFKLNFSKTLLNAGNYITYVSFCENRLDLSKADFQMFMYRLLTKKRLLSIVPELFSCDIQYEYGNNAAVIKCYTRSNKSKLYCKLEQLIKFQDRSTDKLGFLDRFYGSKATNKSIQDVLIQRLTDNITTEIDNQVFEDLEAQVTTAREARLQQLAAAIAAPLRRNLDYQSIARRALVVEEMPNPARPIYDYEQVVEEQPIFPPYNEEDDNE